MGFLDFLRGKGGAGAAPTPAVEYNGFRIRPAPRRQGSDWLVAGVIAKETPEGVKEHAFVRADTYAGLDDARTAAIDKGKRIIDERGDKIFEKA